jgi:hypothetical protein
MRIVFLRSFGQALRALPLTGPVKVKGRKPAYVLSGYGFIIFSLTATNGHDYILGNALRPLYIILICSIGPKAEICLFQRGSRAMPTAEKAIAALSRILPFPSASPGKSRNSLHVHLGRFLPENGIFHTVCADGYCGIFYRA